MKNNPMEKSICGARNRQGEPCRKPPAPGKTRCRLHGGGDNSGAPLDNKNAVTHGIYRRHLTERELEQIGDFINAELPEEIAFARVMLCRAVAVNDLPLVDRFLGRIGNLTRQHFEVTKRPDQGGDGADSVAEFGRILRSFADGSVPDDVDD